VDLRVLRNAIIASFSEKNGLAELIDDLLNAARGDEESPENPSRTGIKRNVAEHVKALRSLGAPKRRTQ